MNMATERLEPAHIKQLLLYAPDDDEVERYERFEQDPAKLSEPDRFIFQVRLLARGPAASPGAAPPSNPCFPAPADADGARVQNPPAEPPLQDHPAGEDGGDEGRVRLHLQGLRGAEGQQEAGQDPGGERPAAGTGR